jgi:hypothetical protein
MTGIAATDDRMQETPDRRSLSFGPAPCSAAALTVLSLGAGVQSSTLALMAAKGQIQPMPALAIFADTQAEPADVYAYLATLEKLLPFPVVRVTQGSLETETLRTWRKKDGHTTVKSSLPTWVFANGESKPLMRKCTLDFKVRPIMRHLRQIRQGRPVEQWIGISLDEAHRMKDAQKPWLINRWPLIEARMNRHDCLRWLDANGYPPPPRSACAFCPYHSNAEWRRLRDSQPEAWQHAIDFEKRMHQAHQHHQTAKHVPYLHRSCVPLEQVDLSTEEDRGQASLWGNECTGMCGV